METNAPAAPNGPVRKPASNHGTNWFPVYIPIFGYDDCD